MADATTVSHATLRSLHRIHRQRTDLSSQMARGPLQIKAGQTGVQAAETELDASRQTLKSARMACDEKQLQLKSREGRVADLEGKLNTAATNREYQMFKEQIAADKQANEVLSDEILEAMDQLEHLESEAKEKETDLADKRSEFEKLEKDVTQRLAGLQSELDRVTAELEETEKDLPSSVMDHYRRIVTSLGEDALAPSESDSCGACGTTFNAQFMNRLFLSHLITCPSCAAIIYLPEGVEPSR